MDSPGRTRDPSGSSLADNRRPTSVERSFSSNPASHRPNRNEAIKLRPNVTFRPKPSNSDEADQAPRKKKFTLDSMLKNARKVTQVHAKPIVESMKDNGHIPNSFLDDLEEAITNKVTSFSRKQDRPFTAEFGRKYSEIRQVAWKKAITQQYKEAPKISYAKLSGLAMVPPDSAILRDPMKSRTYVHPNKQICLPRPCLNWFTYNSYEASEIMSGLSPGRVSTSVEYLDYQTNFTISEGRFYIDELEELRYIYKGFWFLSRINRRNWIRVLYSDANTKIVDYELPRLMAPDGVRKAEDAILFNIEGLDVYTTPERLFSWIQHYRIPRKVYAIGGSESDICVLYAIYLEYLYGIPEDIIKERLTIELIDDVKNNMELLNLGPRPKRDVDSEEDEDEEAMKALGALDVSAIARAQIEATIQTAEYVTEFISVNFKDGLDLSQLDDGRTDSEASSEFGGSEYQEDIDIPGYDLPYDTDLHASNNEFESIYLDLRRNDPEPEEDAQSIADSVHTENMPDNGWTPLEELGIDLIDPSRDATDQPAIRRIDLVWAPGGGSRLSTKRFNSSLVIRKKPP
jgi:hypothetical protein